MKNAFHMSKMLTRTYNVETALDKESYNPEHRCCILFFF